MKKNYFSWGFLAALFLWGTGTVAAQEVEYALNESFEQGLPDGWTQEHVSGSVNWIAETGGDYPAGAADGQGRVALRNTSDQTQGFVTRLVTPAMDLSQMIQPILIFSHAQEHNLGDVDELRIYYRTSADGNWILYEEDGVFTERIRTWQRDTIRLTGINQTRTFYQLAFEGTDRFGQGVVLDWVQVRPEPTCEDPHSMTFDMPTATSFRVNWQASFDSQSYQVRVSTSPLDDPEAATPEELYLDTVVTEERLLLENVETNTTYYIYVKANCGNELSGWGETSYRTNAQENVPYYEDFNMAYTPGYFNRLSTWTWGNTWQDAESNTYSPLINTLTSTSNLHNYSPDTTTSVCFTGGNSVTSSIEPGEAAWVISPELMVDDISQLQVSFWGGVYTYFTDEDDVYASSLIVGIMDDPTRIETFVPIDTVTVSQPELFEEFIVSFSNYTGTGKYVAFVSAFNEQNIFYMDNVAFEYIPTCPKIQQIKVLPAITSAEITVDTKGSPMWDIVITTEEVDDPAAEQTPIFKQEGIASGTVANATGLTPHTRHYLYVRGTNGSDPGPWSNVKEFWTFSELELPLKLGFELDEPAVSFDSYNSNVSSSATLSSVLMPCSEVWNFEKALPPYIMDYNPNEFAKNGDQYLIFAGPLTSNISEYRRGWAVFPPVDDVHKLQLSFWIYVYSGDVAKVKVGVMTDPFDFSTFEEISEFENYRDEPYKQCVVYFDKYEGKGKYIALLNVIDEGGDLTMDDLELSFVPTCSNAANLQATSQPADRTVLLEWEGQADEFRVLIDRFDMTDTLAANAYVDGLYKPMLDTVVTGNSLVVEGLAGATRYYATVRSECTDITSEWWQVQEFSSCIPASLPYVMDFEDFAKEEVGSAYQFLPPCWDTEWVSYTPEHGSLTNYPYIVYSMALPNQGIPENRYLRLNGGNTNPRYRDYVVLPAMDAPLNTLQISFLVESSDQDEALLVGVLPDVTDTATFIPVDTLRPTMTSHQDEWREERVSFVGRNDLPQDARIMLRVENYAYGYHLIDNIVVETATDCNKPDDMRVRNISSDQATLYWTPGGSETAWDVMVLTNEDARPDSASADEILLHRVHTGEPEMTITDEDGLKVNTRYWYYLRAICAENDTTGWTMMWGEFQTGCVPNVVDYIETFEDNANNFDCWVTGCLDGSSIPNRVTEGTKALHLFNISSTNNSYAIMPEIDVDSITRLQLTFDALGHESASNEKRFVVGIVSSVSDLSTFVPMDTIVPSPGIYERYVIYLDAYKGDPYGDYGKHVMFLATKLGEATLNHAYVDNIQLSYIPAHRIVSGVEATDITDVSATIAWDEAKDATGYRVFVSTDSIKEGQPLPTAVFDQTVGSEAISVGVTGLTTLTSYRMYVKAIYSDGESDWSFVRSFTTACPASFAIPYEEGFDKYGEGSGVMPPCWTTFYSSGTNYPQLNDTYNYTIDGFASLYVYTVNTAGYYCMAVSPALDMDNNLTDMRVSFNVLAASEYYTRLIVGLTNQLDSLTLNSYLPLDTICIMLDQPDPQTKVWYPYNYDLTALDTLSNKESYQYVVFAVSRELNRQKETSTTGYSGGLYIDDLRVTPIPTCETPMDVKASNYKEDAFTLKWSSAGTAAQWNIQYGPAGFTLGEGTIVQATDTVWTITGLTPNTVYDVYVQGACGPDDTSEWSRVAQGRTIGVPVTEFPYNYGFEDEADNAYWWAKNDTAHNAWYIGSDVVKDGGKALYISNDGGQTATYNAASGLYSSVWMSRTLKLERGEYTVEFDWTCYGYSSSDFIRAGLLPGDVTFEPSTTSTAGKVTNLDGTTTTMSAYASGTPDEWISLEGLDEDGDPAYKLNLVDTTGGIIDWRHSKTTFYIEEEDAGYYNLVFYWKNSTTKPKHPHPSAVVDNVSVVKEACPTPQDLHSTAIGDTYVDIAWTPFVEDQISWNVKALNTAWDVDSIGMTPDSVVVFSTLVEETPATRVTGLQPYTDYYIYVQGNCDGNWARIDVRTMCSAPELGYVWTFEEEGEYQVGTSSTYMAPDCWIMGLINTTTKNNHPYKITDTTAWTYSMSDGRKTTGTAEHSLYFNTTASYGNYAVMPMFAGNADTLQVSFYARAGYADADASGDGYVIWTSYTTSSYAHSIIVGTMSDPYNIDTFVPLDTVVLENCEEDAIASKENDWLFKEYVVPLAGARGAYVAFVSDFGKSNRVYMENVSIEAVTCARPTNVTIGDIYSDGANLSWTPQGSASSWIVNVALNADTASVFRRDTVYATEYRITDLPLPDQTYYVAVQSYCGEGDASDPTAFQSFRTANVPLWAETFSVGTNEPEGWLFYDEAFASDTLRVADMTPTSANRWYRDEGLGSGHQYANVFGTATSHWLVSPCVELPAAGALQENEDLWLTLDVALTEHGSYSPISGAEPNEDDRFLVVISEDGGNTWCMANATIWGNDPTAPHDYVFNDIPARFQNYQIDLNPYAGKVIRVGLYVESTETNASYDIHVDNVRINRYVEVTPEASQCEGYDYEGEGFYITYDNLEPGENEFQRMVFSNTSAIADSVVNLTVAVTAMPTYTIEATTCEGEPYENYDFEVAAGESGEFKRKLKSEETGCDSVAVLKLNIIETLRVQLLDTICQGQTYTFGGREFNRTGIYVDTVASLVTGCDSITTLVLTVRDALRTTLSEVACFGEPYTFGERILEESGTYVDTLRTDAGCDSIVTLNLTVREEIPPTHIYGYVCPDETYTDEHFEGVPARVEPYELTVTTDWGACDSLLVLHLTELDDDTVYTEYRIDEDELPFTYHGKTYNVGKTGAHVQTLEVTSQSGNCSAVLVATLIIGDNVGMGMTQGGSLTIVPTLINRGQSVRLSGSGAAELEVAVFDMTGRLVFHDESMAMPAELQAFDASGIYTVKAINGNGQVMYGRVIVK